MGRIQVFDTTTVVQAARDLFWDKGYDAASLAEIEGATGVGRSSLYHAFGSKRGLFDAAVADYLDTVIRPRLHGMAAESDGNRALTGYFDGLHADISALRDDSPRRGCLLVNCAAGLAGHDESVREVVDGYRRELTDAFRAALLTGSSGSVADAEPARVDERARTLASLSMSSMLLARVNREESIALLATAIGLIQAWTSPA